MSSVLFGNDTAAKVLLYVANYGEGYAQGIARTFGVPLNMVQKQLARFERGGVLVSRLVGRTRLFSWNPRCPLRTELEALLRRSLDLLPPDEVRRYYRERRRPRRTGKPR